MLGADLFDPDNDERAAASGRTIPESPGRNSHPLFGAHPALSQVEHTDQANDNEVDCHDKVEQAWHDQN